MRACQFVSDRLKSLRRSRRAEFRPAWAVALALVLWSHAWTPAAAQRVRPSADASSIAVSLAKVSIVAGAEQAVALSVNPAGGSFRSFEATITFDPGVAVVVANSAASGAIVGADWLMVANTTTPGTARIAMAGATAITATGELLRLTFKAMGASGTSTPLTLSNVSLDEGGATAAPQNGQITVVDSTSAFTGHPADANSDFRLVIGEVTAYGSAWKRGLTWATAPVPIPIGYVTRAGYLWRAGETYRRDAGACPACWMPLTALPAPEVLSSFDEMSRPRGPWSPGFSEITAWQDRSGRGSLVPGDLTAIGSPLGSLSPESDRLEIGGGRPPKLPKAAKAEDPGDPSAAVVLVSSKQTAMTGVATRKLPATYAPKVPLTITIEVTPPADAQSWAVEEKVPAGWRVSDISADGHWDKDANVVRWGPFFDEASQTLRYTLTPPVGATGSQELKGTASFDGVDVAIGGRRALPPAPVVRPGEPGKEADSVAASGSSDRSPLLRAR